MVIPYNETLDGNIKKLIVFKSKVVNNSFKIKKINK